MNAVNGAVLHRTAQDKGVQVTITVVQYDSGLMEVRTEKGREPCDDRAEVNRVVGNVIDKLDTGFGTVKAA
jgi:hypothetical protein